MGAVKGFKASSVANGQIRMSANVKSPKRKTVRGVLIFLSRQPEGQIMIVPNCSCGADELCSHAVAVMHEFLKKGPQGGSFIQRPSQQARSKRARVLDRAREQARRETRYLSCQLVTDEQGRLYLEPLLSPRSIIDTPQYESCSYEMLASEGFGDQLGQKWMRTLALRFLQLHEQADHPLTETRIAPDAETWRDLIDELLKWQVLYWGGGANPVMLHEGEGIPATPGWKYDSDRECFVTHWETPQDLEIIVPSAPPCYVDPRTRRCGFLHTDVNREEAAHWLSGNRQPSKDTIKAWNAACGCSFFPHPPSETIIDGRELKPTVRFRLFHEELPRSTMRGVWSPVYQEQPVAELLFRYEHTLIQEQGDGLAMDDPRVRVLRNESAEREAAEFLQQLGLTTFAKTLPSTAVTDALANLRWIGSWEPLASQTAWMTFMTEKLTLLETRGWEIDYADNFAMRFVRPDRWIQKLREQRNRSWFEFELGIECEGKRVDLIPVILTYLRNHGSIERQLEHLDPEENIPVQLDDGRYLAFPVGRFKPIVKILRDLLEENRGQGDHAVPVHQLMAAELLKDAAEYTDAGESTKALQAIANQLGDFTGIEKRSTPEGLQAELRPYQQTGFQWLQFLSQYGLAGILADDMGLGKTLQTIAHLLTEKEAGRLTKPSLIIAPTSLLGNWRDELAKFAPALRVHVHYGLERHGKRQAFDAADVILTSYALVYRDQTALEKCCFSHLILDEAQNIKNPNSRSAQAACALDAENRLCLSGTPMENHLEELWSLFHFLMPGFLGRLESFRTQFRHPIEKEGDLFIRDLLAHRVGPLMLRRRKTEVAKELPPKTEMIRSVELEGPQRDLYETIRASMQERVLEVIEEQGIERAHLYILDALLKLRQVCCHPRLLALEAAQHVETSAKMELLFELIPEMIAEGRRILLFSQFTSMLGLIQKRLEEEAIPFVKLTGRTRNRDAVVKRFQNQEVPLFLISLKAGGVGLNLTQADTVIHYDPWWNPAVEAQATDRAYRIGQDQPVFVYKLITQGSIEERIVAMQEDKKELVEGLLAEGAKRSLTFSKNDLEQLLQPLG